MIAQLAHPTQADSSVQVTGACPLRLRRVFEISRIFLGQAVTHNPQPLHKSSLNVSFATSSSPLLERVLYQKIEQSLYPRLSFTLIPVFSGEIIPKIGISPFNAQTKVCIESCG
jgi:hypothetical protein